MKSADVHIQSSYFFDVREVLRRDLSDGNVVDIDVLLADEVELQVQRAFVDVTDSHRKREIALRFVWRSPRSGRIFAGNSGRSCWRIRRIGNACQTFRHSFLPTYVAFP